MMAITGFNIFQNILANKWLKNKTKTKKKKKTVSDMYFIFILFGENNIVWSQTDRFLFSIKTYTIFFF